MGHTLDARTRFFCGFDRREMGGETSCDMYTQAIEGGEDAVEIEHGDAPSVGKRNSLTRSTRGTPPRGLGLTAIRRPAHHKIHRAP